jgi:hypothetical protein
MVHAPGTAFAALLEELTRLSDDPKYANLEVTSLSSVLWTRYGAGKLGILQLRPIRADEETPITGEYEEWEGKAIAAYLDRHNL